MMKMSPKDIEDMDQAARRKCKNELRKTATEDGLEEVILDMAVDLKVNTTMDRQHRAAPLHKAHPITRETVVYIVIGAATLLILAGILTPEQVAAIVPGGG